MTAPGECQGNCRSFGISASIFWLWGLLRVRVVHFSFLCSRLHDPWAGLSCRIITSGITVLPNHKPDKRPSNGAGLMRRIWKAQTRGMNVRFHGRKSEQFHKAVLIDVREQPVVGFKLDFMAPNHCIGQQSASKSSCQIRRYGRREEEAGMSARSGAGSLCGNGDVEGPADVIQSGYVLLPTPFVKVDRKEVAGFILAQWVDARDDTAPQVRFHGSFIQGGIGSLIAGCALDSKLW